MRNIFVFLWRYNFFLFFVILEIVAFSLIVRNNFYQKSLFFNSSNFVFSNILNLSNSVTQYFTLKSINEQLVKENAFLKSLHRSSYIISVDTITIASDSLFMRKFSYVPAKIVNNSFNRVNNYITINAGSKNNIKSGMGVLSPKGVAGIVKDVSNNFAAVYSVLHSNMKISGKLKNTSIVGTVIWNQKHHKYASFIDIAKYHQIEIGDTIVTSGFSKIFPEGIPIGFVSSYSYAQTGDFYDIKIELATDFSNIEYVYVVVNHIYQEQEVLELMLENE